MPFLQQTSLRQVHYTTWQTIQAILDVQHWVDRYERSFVDEALVELRNDE